MSRTSNQYVKEFFLRGSLSIYAFCRFQRSYKTHFEIHSSSPELELAGSTSHEPSTGPLHSSMRNCAHIRVHKYQSQMHKDIVGKCCENLRGGMLSLK